MEAEELTSTLNEADSSLQNSKNDVNEHQKEETKSDAKSDDDDKSAHEPTGTIELDDHEEVKNHEEVKDSASHKLSKSEPAVFANTSVEAADMERDARLQAGRTLAQVFAHKAEEVLTQRSKDEEGAKALEKLAASLRLNATHLVQKAPADAEQAAVDAADSAAKRTLGQAKALEAQATKAAAEAATERDEALAAMSSAMKAQNDMTSLVRHLRASA